jgi:hypothetical protein
MQALRVLLLRCMQPLRAKVRASACHAAEFMLRRVRSQRLCCACSAAAMLHAASA